MIYVWTYRKYQKNKTCGWGISQIIWYVRATKCIFLIDIGSGLWRLLSSKLDTQSNYVGLDKFKTHIRTQHSIFTAGWVELGWIGFSGFWTPLVLCIEFLLFLFFIVDAWSHDFRCFYFFFSDLIMMFIHVVGLFFLWFLFLFLFFV